jgi:hypothetical protein
MKRVNQKINAIANTEFDIRDSATAAARFSWTYGLYRDSHFIPTNQQESRAPTLQVQVAGTNH